MYANETFLLPFFSRRQNVSLYLWTEKNNKYFTSIHWKSTVVFNHLPYSTGNTKHISCEVLPHKILGSRVAFLSTMEQFSFPFYFSVHKTFVRVHCVSMLVSMIVAFMHTIDPTGSLKRHGKVFRVPGFLTLVGCACWECQLLEAERGQMHLANYLCVILLSLGLSPKPTCWII